jgi:hypothetical protein
MRVTDSLCVRVLRQPGIAAQLDLSGWDLLIRQGRRANLLARLAHLFEMTGIWSAIPEQPRRHLESERLVAERRAQAVRQELEHIREALTELGYPVVLLKGAAYLAAGLPPSTGRHFSDIDLLVPRVAIEQAELALKIKGWSSSYHSEYDQRYYREWMHEIPPLRHLARASVIDLHHAILPPTARIKTDPAPLFKAAQPLPGDSLFCVLTPPDMVLHSATHLFQEGEFHNGLRDLTDLHLLLREFGREPDFWNKLFERARVLNLTRPLFYALHYTQRILATPLPDTLPGMDGPLSGAAMDLLFDRVLAPPHASCSDAMTPLVRGALYIRGHWLRMPLHLLLPHLVRKTFLKGLDEPGRKKITGPKGRVHG